MHEQEDTSTEIEFEKLKEAGLASNLRTGMKSFGNDDDENMDLALNAEWGVSSKFEYQDMLAPFDDTEDYSTSSLLKNKGANLT